MTNGALHRQVVTSQGKAELNQQGTSRGIDRSALRFSIALVCISSSVATLGKQMLKQALAVRAGGAGGGTGALVVRRRGGGWCRRRWWYSGVGGGAGGIGGTGGVGGTGGIGGTRGAGGGDPAEIVAKALLCFNDKHIYSNCEESCRLTQSGNINVSPEHVEEYCNGPCLTETHLVLDCIEDVLANFIFYNRATINDIKDTIKAGCGYGPERGDFNVAEHIQAEENSAYKTPYKILFGLGVMIIARGLLL
ncbi:uncharacterized protein LOC116122823 [Pistacia vera]|uniref:uncharacterized protein LOC116122823 n=1 Tax=Pistacia vera TaxID=55513 RepID=UPI001263A405|nr:uncharacterized protein LOC116122823 [Pistacia vera]